MGTPHLRTPQPVNPPHTVVGVCERGKEGKAIWTNPLWSVIRFLLCLLADVGRVCGQVNDGFLCRQAAQEHHERMRVDALEADLGHEGLACERLIVVE